MAEGNLVPGLRFFGLNELRQVYETSRTNPGVSALESKLASLSITYEVRSPEVEPVPKTGSVLAVANHPFGLLKGASVWAAK
jgi:putative hemolysin